MHDNTIFSENDFREQAQKDGITHISTGVAVVRDGKLLMTRRVANDFLGGVYEFPGGGVDEGETILQGAIRETKEETGLTVTKVLATFEGFDYSTNRKPAVRQVNFLVEVEPGDVVLSPEEHDEYMWVDEASSAHLTVSDDTMRNCVAAAFACLHKIQQKNASSR